MYIKPSANAKSLWDINEDIATEALLSMKSMDIPCPWDADIEIEGDKVIIEGSILGSDANKYNNAGYCRCEISVEKFSQAYVLEIPEDVVKDMSPEELKALWDGGWERA